MDPNACLREIRALYSIELNDNARPLKVTEAYRLAELIEGLDQWLSKGGALPTQWLTPYATTSEQEDRRRGKASLVREATCEHCGAVAQVGVTCRRALKEDE